MESTHAAATHDFEILLGLMSIAAAFESLPLLVTDLNNLTELPHNLIDIALSRMLNSAKLPT
jgi:hypothetical protein